MDFNPRSHEGSDRCYNITKYDYCYFNPRSHEGSDRGERIYINGEYGFQSALPRGERRCIRLSKRAIRGFQSALPRGERLQLCCTQNREWDFNPRSHEGSDKNKEYMTADVHHISIRAPTRGATDRFIEESPAINISIRAPTRGATIS